mmetsp:Transcript_6273/g.19652  ORF Transcript_6273/g.19652 Transcript_6273/m.19652 type:complete len:110 (+) Transcript_6273:3-332(+)
MVDEERAKQVEALHAEHPDWLGYLLTQAPEYKKLKETCAHFALHGGDRPTNVATIQTAINALKLAEHLTDRLLTPTKPEAAAPADAAAPAPAPAAYIAVTGSPPIEVVS